MLKVERTYTAFVYIDRNSISEKMCTVQGGSCSLIELNSMPVRLLTTSTTTRALLRNLDLKYSWMSYSLYKAFDSIKYDVDCLVHKKLIHNRNKNNLLCFVFLWNIYWNTLSFIHLGYYTIRIKPTGTSRISGWGLTANHGTYI